MSSSVMRQRLTELLGALVVHQLPDSRYELTTRWGGMPASDSAGSAQWSERWAAMLAPHPAHRNRERPADGASHPDTVEDGMPWAGFCRVMPERPGLTARAEPPPAPGPWPGPWWR
ncbi:hypothetical protein SGLAM104S_04204 [Streptomyces glaucescens]